MFIQAEKIYLRALEPNDLELLYQMENNLSVWDVSNTITPFSRDILKLFLETAHQDIFTNKQLRLMICLNSNHAVVGTVDLFDFDPHHLRIGIGILIIENFRKQGFAHEAIKLSLDYCFNTLLVNQVFCNISDKNIESIKLFEHSNFIFAGNKKVWNRIGVNDYEDELIYQCFNPKNQLK